MLNASCWWAKCLPHHTPGDSGLIPLDLEENPSPPSSRTAAFHLRRRHRSLLRACVNSGFLLLGAFFIGLAISLIDRSLAISSPFSASRIDRFHRDYLRSASGSNSSIAAHLRRLTRLPHAAGSPENILLADYIRDSFQISGLRDTRFSDFQVLLTFPLQRQLSLHRSDGSLLSELLRESEKRNFAGNPIPGFHAYSPSGEAEGDVVYANYGRAEDFQELFRLGVNASGKLVLARYGEIFRGDIVENAAKAGASAVIIFSDLREFGGNGSRGFFPDSSWLPPGGVQRGTVMQGSGDPVTPGWPSVPGTERLRVSEARLPAIPSLPISAVDAEPILRAMSGPAAPPGWQGGVENLVYSLGGAGAVKLKFRYIANQTVSVIRNVFAVIEGSEEPDRFILLGNHRDAWTYGAVDPSSGTAALLETAHRLGRLLKGGWKPRRSIVLCSWDAEEFGMVGSTEWVEQNLDLLGARAVAYLNVDCAVSGPGFHAGATPQLDDLLVDIAKQVKDPDSSTGTVYDSWASGSSGSSPLIDRLGSTGSDYVAFLHHAGVPAVDMYFGKSYPVYHSLYDNYEWMSKFGDPDFTRHVAASSMWGLLALRLADCLVLPFDYKSYATQLRAYAETVETAVAAAGAPANVYASPLRNAIAEFGKSAACVADESQKLGSEAVLRRRSLNDRLMLTERAFLEEGGLAGRGWYKHLIYGPSRNNKYGSAAFPGILDAIEEAAGGLRTGGEWEAVQHEIWRVSRVLARASLVLRGELA